MRRERAERGTSSQEDKKMHENQEPREHISKMAGLCKRKVKLWKEKQSPGPREV